MECLRTPLPFLQCLPFSTPFYTYEKNRFSYVMRRSKMCHGDTNFCCLVACHIAAKLITADRQRTLFDSSVVVKLTKHMGICGVTANCASQHSYFLFLGGLRSFFACVWLHSQLAGFFFVSALLSGVFVSFSLSPPQPSHSTHPSKPPSTKVSNHSQKTKNWCHGAKWTPPPARSTLPLHSCSRLCVHCPPSTLNTASRKVHRHRQRKCAPPSPSPSPISHPLSPPPPFFPPFPFGPK